MSEQLNQDDAKREIRKVLNREKLSVLIIPVVLFTLGYGFQLLLQPDILLHYAWYELIKTIIYAHAIGLLFMLLPIGIIIGYLTTDRFIMLAASGALILLWGILTLSYLIAPPPNTVWLFTSLMVYLTYSMAVKI